MGYGSWTASSWTSYSSTHVSGCSSVSGRGGLFSADSMADELNPKNITVRESRDSADNPNSTPIILALDVTGSMSPVLRSMVTNLNTLMQEVYDRQPVPNPQICFMAVGDVDYDSAPLQVTQFESDIKIAESLQKIYFEQGGGGNDHESYTLPWYFASQYVSADAIEKRHKKGILITMGDECCPTELTSKQIKKVFGDAPEEDISSADLLDAVSRDWEVYHLVIKQGNFYSARYRDHDGPAKIEKTWGALLGQHCLYVSDYTKLAEVIVSLLETLAGKDVDTICSSWDGSTSVVVREAISGLTTTTSSATSGLVEF